MKTKLRDMNKDTQLLALDFLDYSVDNGKMPLWTQVGTKDFLMCLITLLKTRDVIDVQTQILFVVEKWGKKFDQHREILPMYKEVYSSLKTAGVTFPTGCTSNYSKYIDSNKSMQPHQDNYDDDDDYNAAYDANDNKKSLKSGSNENSNYREIYTSLGLNVNLFEKKYTKLVLKLLESTESIILSNDMIDNSQLGKKDELLRNIIHDLRYANSQIIETISSDKLKDERLMEISLGISEDISKTLKRYDSIKKQRKPEPLLSYFLENNVQMKSMPKEKPREQPQMDLFEGFESQPQISRPMQNPPSSSTSNVNDLFDIFSNPQPVNNNKNVIINQQSNVGSFDLFANTNNNNNQVPQQQQLNMGFNQSGNLFDQLSSNTQQSQLNANKQNLLSEQLRMAYGNNSTSSTSNMGMGIGMGNNNINVVQPPINNSMNYMKSENLMNISHSINQSNSFNPQSNSENHPIMSHQQILSNSMNQFNQNQNINTNPQQMNLEKNNNNNFNQSLAFNQQNQNLNIPNPYSSLFN